MNRQQNSKSEQVRLQLLDSIRSGKFKEGECIPSDNELTAYTRTSRATVREAVSKLVSAGYLERIQGKGTFIRKLNPDSSDKLIGLLAIDLLNLREKNPFLEEILMGIHSRILKDGKSVFISVLQKEEDFKEKLKHGLLPDSFNGGVILTDNLAAKENVAALRAHGISCVSIGHPSNCHDVPYVDADHFAGGYMAVEHLVGLGHKNIAVIDRSYPHALSAEDRRRGILKAMKDMQLNQQLELFKECRTPDTEGGYEAMKKILKSGIKFSAVIIYGDRTLPGAMQAMKEHGLKTPEDVSVIACMGYSRLYEELEFIPTAILQPLREMGACAAGMLAAYDFSGENKVFRPYLTKGSSCAQAIKNIN